uniref:Uncharacterized protein n=1 Tax=Zea mays TaxID=4577 RepID=C4IYR6_MAIZE|nr:unknown [Zea mays]
MTYSFPSKLHPKQPHLGLRRPSISVHLFCSGSYTSTLDKLSPFGPNPPATYITPLTSAQAKSHRATFILASTVHLLRQESY